MTVCLGGRLTVWVKTSWSRFVKWFRGGLVFKAHRLVYHSTLGWRVIKKKKKVEVLRDGREPPGQTFSLGARLVHA